MAFLHKFTDLMFTASKHGKYITNSLKSLSHVTFNFPMLDVDVVYLQDSKYCCEFYLTLNKQDVVYLQDSKYCWH